jgi:hypothetical protein
MFAMGSLTPILMQPETQVIVCSSKPKVWQMISNLGFNCVQIEKDYKRLKLIDQES